MPRMSDPTPLIQMIVMVFSFLFVAQLTLLTCVSRGTGCSGLILFLATRLVVALLVVFASLSGYSVSLSLFDDGGSTVPVAAGWGGGRLGMLCRLLGMSAQYRELELELCCCLAFVGYRSVQAELAGIESSARGLLCVSDWNH